MNHCIANGCSSQSRAKNMCMKHYMRKRKHGSTEIVESRIIHGMTGTPEHYAWKAMNSRCSNQYSKDYSNYGARGITVCDEWANNFQSFYDDMGVRPDGTSIDRIDNDGDYERGNCRWSTPREQSLNQRIPKNNTSGYRGIWQSKYRNRWYASASNVYIGCYLSKEEAAWMYDQYAIEINGNNPHLNYEYI